MGTLCYEVWADIFILPGGLGVYRDTGYNYFPSWHFLERPYNQISILDFMPFISTIGTTLPATFMGSKNECVQRCRVRSRWLFTFYDNNKHRHTKKISTKTRIFMVVIDAEATRDHFPEWIPMVSKSQRVGSIASGYLCCIV